MNEYTYYPGCSLKGNSKHYEESLLPVFKKLGMEFEEMDDWNCCGATAYFSVDETMAMAISGRNLSIAEKTGKDLMAPCAGCYLTLKKSNNFLNSGIESARKILNDLKNNGNEYKGSINVIHPLEVLIQDFGMDAIKEKVILPLKGFKVASYYGCQLVRPFSDFDNPDYPVHLDNIMEALGAEAVDYSAKTRCCGGSLTGTITDIGRRLNYILLKEAKRKGADAIVTICPLCQFNLELMQAGIEKEFKEKFKIPILYFTQLMGVSFGIPKEDLGFSRSVIPLNNMWAKINNGGSK
jgi:heterodisulfide reductase subunit B